MILLLRKFVLNSAKLAAQFNYDVRALGRYYQERQKLENRVVVSRKPRLIKDLPPNIQKITTIPNPLYLTK